MTALAPVLEAFFTDRLMTQRGASPHTIASYRDTFTLLLGYIHQQTGKLPAQLDLADLDPATIGAFLQQLETSRGNSPATRNARLAAIRSLFRYASLRAPRARGPDRPRPGDPAQAHHDHDRQLLDPRRTRRPARRPRPGHLARPPRPRPAGLRRPDRTACLRADRAQRSRRPPRHRPARLLPRQGPQRPRHPAHSAHRGESSTAWLAEQHAGTTSPLFATRAGTALSRDAVEHLVTRHAATAARACPTLQTKKITPHTLRHTAAMNLLHAGVDITCHRPMDGPRKSGNHPHLPARRHGS